MKDPCIGCTQEYPRCRRICPFGVRYQMEQAEIRERANAERAKDTAYNVFKADRVFVTSKRVNR